MRLVHYSELPLLCPALPRPFILKFSNKVYISSPLHRNSCFQVSDVKLPNQWTYFISHFTWPFLEVELLKLCLFSKKAKFFLDLEDKIRFQILFPPPSCYVVVGWTFNSGFSQYSILGFHFVSSHSIIPVAPSIIVNIYWVLVMF